MSALRGRERVEGDGDGDGRWKMEDGSYRMEGVFI